MNDEEVIKAITEIDTSVREMRMQLDMRFDYIEQDINQTIDRLDELAVWKTGIVGAQRVLMYLIGTILVIIGIVKMV